MSEDRLKKSRCGYEDIHARKGFVDEMEVYEVLASILRGNRAIDIGCGEGFVESFCDDIIGIDFSLNALRRARENGAKIVIQAVAEKLPFKENSFDIALSSGVLEHCVDQEEAIREMARLSKIQVLVVHARLPFLLEHAKPMINKLFGLKDQPVEKPLTMKRLKKMVKRSGLRVIYEGFWNYVDLRYLYKKLPYGLVKIPSHHFLISIKTENLERPFLKGL